MASKNTKLGKPSHLLSQSCNLVLNWKNLDSSIDQAMVKTTVTSIEQDLSLYDQDFCLWIETTVNQLKTGQLQELDLVNLIEELEAMVRSEKHSLESNLRGFLLHLIKYKYQPSKRSKSWRSSIVEHRIRIRKIFKNSPSLKGYFEIEFAESYQDARKLAAIETGLSIDTFPLDCPFTQEETLNEDFLPE